MSISIMTVCQITSSPKELYILIQEYDGGYIFSISKGTPERNSFLLSSQDTYPERDDAVRKMATTLRMMRAKRSREISGGFLTEEHIEKIESFLLDGNNSLVTGSILE